MVCRDERSKGEAACEELITTETPDAHIDLVSGDLGTVLASVYKLGQELNRRYGKVDVLIHYAGIWPCEMKLNEDGIESAFMVNHLASFLLTHLLLKKNETWIEDCVCERWSLRQGKL